MTVLAAGGSIGAGTWAFIVVVVLVVGSILLFRSMNRHLRKVPTSFDEAPEETSDQPPDNG